MANPSVPSAQSTQSAQSFGAVPGTVQTGAQDPGAPAIICSKCRTVISGPARFCPQCGTALGKNSGHILKLAGVSLVCGALLAFGVTKLQTGLIGVRPTKSAPASAAVAAASRVAISDKLDPEIIAAQEKLSHDPKNPDLIRGYVSILLDRAQSPDVSAQLVFELIEALGALLEINPNDTNALLSLADLSFNQRAFDQAAKFYERYLVLAPKDLKTKARYASSIQFLGRVEESEKILKEIVASEPKNFEALAYLSIAYAQQGRTPDALKIGEQALAAAPEKEAEVRFSAFLNELKKKQSEPPKPPARGIHENAGLITTGSTEEAVTTYLSTHPIAGDKFVSALVNGEVLTISMRNFPMSAMPPFVKEKFVAGVTQHLSNKAVHTLRFVDAESGETLHEEKVP